MITFSKIGSFGRLGNQMFQISAAIGLAEKNKDVAIFNKWEYAKYFKNPIRQDLIPSNITRVFHEKTFHYSPITYCNGTDLIGYFQSEKYFVESSEIIRKHFEFIDGIYGDEIDTNKESCSVHIRRGDYLNLSHYHPVQDLNYYNRSISYMREKGITKFYVFSDDIEWCIQNIQNSGDIVYVSGNTDIKDLALMSICKHNIIANSSFSWWGAWLNKNKQKIVISPSIWFGPAKKGVITDDLYCPGWLKF